MDEQFRLEKMGIRKDLSDLIVEVAVLRQIISGEEAAFKTFYDQTKETLTSIKDEVLAINGRVRGVETWGAG